MEIDIDVLDAHDRNEHFIKQDFNINECVDSLLKQQPFGKYPFYAFVHTRTHEDGVFKKRLIWQPRLSKPQSAPNTMLFKLFPESGEVQVIWILPDDRLWNQFAPRMIGYNETIWISIQNFKHHRAELDRKDPNDLSDEKIDQIYRELSHEAKKNKKNPTSDLLKAYDNLDSETKKLDGLVCFEPPSRNYV